MTRSYRAFALAVVATLALAASSTAATVKAKSAIGTLQKVDGQTLTVQTQKGTETMMLAPSARIRSHAKAVSTADLSAHVGDRVKVRYTENNGQKQASTVTLSSATASAPRKASNGGHSSKKGGKS